MPFSDNIDLLRISETFGEWGCYSGVRPALAYMDTDVVIMAFNIMDRPSFENITSVWNKEKKEYTKKAKVQDIILSSVYIHK